MKKIFRSALVWCIIAAMLSGMTAVNARFPSKNWDPGLDYGDKAVTEETEEAAEEVEEPADETEEPAEEPADEPADEPAEESADEPAEEPAEETEEPTEDAEEAEVTEEPEKIEEPAELVLQVNGEIVGTTEYAPTFVLPEIEFEGETAIAPLAPMFAIGYYPARDVVEAMGGTVDYKDDILTIDMGYVKVSTDINTTAFTVTYEDGTSEDIDAGIGVFKHPITWTTYIPDVFIINILGWNVGYDAENSAIILIDPYLVMDNAMSGKEFTILEKLNEAFPSEMGSVETDITFDMLVSLEGIDEEFALGGGMSGIIDTESMKMDVLCELIMDIVGLDIEDEADAEMLAMLANGMKMNLRTDIENGKMYIGLDPAMLGEMGAMLPGGMKIWLEADAADLGLDISDLTGSLTIDANAGAIAQMIVDEISMLSVDSITSFAEVSAYAEVMALVYSDAGFEETEYGYISYFELSDEGYSQSMAIMADVDEDGNIIGMANGTDIYSEYDGIVISLLIEQTVDGETAISLEAETAEAYISMMLEGTIIPTDKEPTVKPDAGAIVLPLDMLTGGEAAMPAIPGLSIM